MDTRLAQRLNDALGIRGVADVIGDRGGLPAVWIEGTRGRCAGTAYLHGGHVASWKPHGFDEVLWVSEKSVWKEGKAIRGGVPVCFPWFGPLKEKPAFPAHGFARLREWTLEKVADGAAGVEVVFAMTSDAGTREFWPHDFVLRHRITFGERLEMALELTNTGKSAFTAEAAQHTYFAVGDVRQVRVKGLAGVRYIDKVDSLREKRQEGDVMFTGETDRVYLDPAEDGVITIEDPVKRRRIMVHRSHARAAVVWNPWVEKAKAMADFGDEEWPGMVCVETANVGEGAVMVPPGEMRAMVTRVEVAAL